MLEIVKLLNYVVPMFGNKHSSPYGKLLISEGNETTAVKFHEDTSGSTCFTYKRRKYYIRNVGSLYHPRFVIKENEL